MDGQAFVTLNVTATDSQNSEVASRTLLLPPESEVIITGPTEIPGTELTIYAGKLTAHPERLDTER
jgi:hypothetical protein